MTMRAWYVVPLVLAFGLSVVAAAEPSPKPAASPARPGVLFLDESHGPEVYANGILSNELVRQSLLIAARHELGLITRDFWLGDSMPTEGDNAPLRIQGNRKKPSELRLARGFHPAWKELAAKDFQFQKFSFQGQSAHKELLIHVEKLSRTDFVELLKQAGFGGKPIKKGDAVPSDDIEKQLAEMTFSSQYLALRKIHQAIRDQGESPQLLGALVRGYGQLGLLTEFYWQPTHKVFKARALLYAQRMVAAEPKSAWAKWHRAHALAMSGLNAHSLADLDAAAKESKTASADASLKQPDWVDHIRAFCRFEVGKLKPEDVSERQTQLRLLLRYVATERASHMRIRACKYEAAQAAYKVMPDCYRTYSGLSRFGPEMNRVNAGFPALLGKKIYGRLDAAPELPTEARVIVKQHTPSMNTVRSLFGFGRSSEPSPNAEFKTRGKLIAALRNAGKMPTGAEAASADAPGPDTNELSWAVLGDLIEELSFEHVTRRILSTHGVYSGPIHEFLPAATALFADHPYLNFVESHTSDPEAKRKAIERMAKKFPARAELQACRYVIALNRAKNPAGRTLWRVIGSHRDEIPYDIDLQIYHEYGAGRVICARRLLKADPYSPHARSILVNDDWSAVEQHAAKWEKEAADHPGLLAALGKRYVRLERYADAERCLEAAKELSLEREVYGKLAYAYKRQGRKDKWRATLQEYLDQARPSLEHSQVYITIAFEHMRCRDWERAEPYAKSAAGTGSAGGLRCGSACYEGLQNMELAERYVRRMSTRYGVNFQWYFFCKRTGHGNLESARACAQKRVDALEKRGRPDDYYDVRKAIYHMLEGNLEKASAWHEKEFAKESNLWYGLHAALLADEANDVKKQTALLKRIETESPKYMDKVTGKPRTELIALAALIADDLANGGKGAIDPAAVDKINCLPAARDYMNFHYFLGKYLDLHGKTDEAIKYWKLAMSGTAVYDRNRTLAGAGLCKHGIKPESYRPLLQGALRPVAKPGDTNDFLTNERVKIHAILAYEHMRCREWEEALPHAEFATGTNSWRGLTCGYSCYEGLQDLKRAESCVRAMSTSYADHGLQWYFFCKRTGYGDLESARKLAQERVKSLEKGAVNNIADEVATAVYRMLEGELEKASVLHENEFAKEPNPWCGLHAALLADEAKDVKKQTALLKRIEAEGPKYMDKATGKPRTELIALAALIADDLAKGGKGEIDSAAVEKINCRPTANDYANFNYYLGKYLDLHGKTDEAIKYWKLAMSGTVMYDPNRTLAGAELCKHGVKPESYKPLLHREEQPDADTKADEQSPTAEKAAATEPIVSPPVDARISQPDVCFAIP